MATKTIGIILNGATGRILLDPARERTRWRRSARGRVAGGRRPHSCPRLNAGRGATRRNWRAWRKAYGAEWTTDLDKVLADPAFTIFFDAAATSGRQGVLERAIAAGKHIYGREAGGAVGRQGPGVAARHECARLKHGAVEDKLGLPVCRSSRGSRRRISSAAWSASASSSAGGIRRTEVACQRPSWNYRQKDGGGLILDMYPHWRYVIENTLGPMRRVITAMSTATPERIDEHGARYNGRRRGQCRDAH